MFSPTPSALRVTALAALLTLIMAAPVLRSPTTQLFGDEIVGRHADAYTVIAQFAKPQPLGPLTQPATDYAGASLARLTGNPVLALNLLVLLTFPLTALATFLLARHLDLAPAGAALAALAFAFSPFHVAHAAYHPHIAQTQWLPIYFLALFRCLDRWSPTRTAALLAATAVLVLSNFYFGFFAAVLTPVAAFAYWIWGGLGPQRLRARDLGLTALSLATAVGAGLLYLLRFAPMALQRPETFAFPREDLLRYSARWWSYVLPPVRHPLAGSWVEAIWTRHGIADGLVEQQVYIGAGLAALAVTAAVGWMRGDRRRAPLRAVPVLAILAVAAFVCSLSPDGTYGGMRVLRPSGLLYAVAPMFRAYARFGTFVGLAVAILAGIGLDRLLAGRRRLVAAGLAVVVGIELAPFPPWRSHDVLPTAAHRRLAQEPAGTISLLDCTSSRDAAARPLANTFPHPVRLLGGDLNDCSEPHLADKLAAVGITHVVNRPNVPVGLRLDPTAPPPGLRLIERFADSDLLAVEATPAPIVVQRLVGFSWREFTEAHPAGDATFRWMERTGSLQVENRTGSPLSATLALELAAFGHDRELVITHPGGETQVAVTTTRAWYQIGPFPLAPGNAVVGLTASGEPLSIKQLTGEGDDRLLSIALWQWDWTIADAR